MKKEVRAPCCSTCTHYWTINSYINPCNDCKNFEYYEEEHFSCKGCKYENGFFKICKECTDFNKYKNLERR